MSLLPLKDGNMATFALLEHSKCVADYRIPSDFGPDFILWIQPALETNM